MKFRAQVKQDFDTSKYLIYRATEYSFDTVCARQGAVASVLINDINLEVSDDGKIQFIWGYCPFHSWKRQSLIVPQAVPGEVAIVTNEPFTMGTSQALYPQRLFPIFADETSGWVVVRGDSKPELAVMIMDGVIIEVDYNQEFCALWLKPQTGFTEKIWESLRK